MMKFVVYLLDYTNYPDGYTCNKLLLPKFVAEGDAIAYAKWRGETVPTGKAHCFEVYKGARKLYRAG